MAAKNRKIARVLPRRMYQSKDAEVRNAEKDEAYKIGRGALLGVDKVQSLEPVFLLKIQEHDFQVLQRLWPCVCGFLKQRSHQKSLLQGRLIPADASNFSRISMNLKLSFE